MNIDIFLCEFMYICVQMYVYICVHRDIRSLFMIIAVDFFTCKNTYQHRDCY
jgi:hypothetical protein